jgi:hypothetical protein
MGVFDDKKFESLDWISQATEPIDSRLNEVLGKIPDEITVDFDLYYKSIGNGYSYDLSVSCIVQDLCKNLGYKLSYNELAYLFKNFELSASDNVIFDFEQKKIIGEVKLIKINNTMDEKVLESMLGHEGISNFDMCYLPHDSLTRLNEVLELLQAKEGLATRSLRKKKVAVSRRLKALFKTNEWKIKDTELANKVGTWAMSYCRDNDAAAFANLCKLKVMTHKGLPIYSMEEVK